MFVKHLEEQNFFDYGFTLNALSGETYSKWSIDSTTISTFVQVWMDVNIYKFKAVTDVEGVVELGKIHNKKQLQEIHERYFKNHKRNFLIRQLTPIENREMFGQIMNSSDDEIDKMVKRRLEIMYEKS